MIWTMKPTMTNWIEVPLEEMAEARLWLKDHNLAAGKDFQMGVTVRNREDVHLFQFSDPDTAMMFKLVFS